MADTIDPFAKILSSAEFALTALLRKAHELHGVTSDSRDLFEAFTVDALHLHTFSFACVLHEFLRIRVSNQSTIVPCSRAS